MTDLHGGVCSVTFRKESPGRIISECEALGIGAIEWGADVHVPPGRLDNAARIMRMCADSGIRCPSYGSYYRAGKSDPASFAAVIAAASELGCETIRVWAGDRGPAPDEDYYRRVADDARRIASAAEEAGLTISFESHQDTLTETPDSRAKLDSFIVHENVRHYWQPPHGMDDSACLTSLEALGDRLTNIHVFHWRPDPALLPPFERLPLQDGVARWSRFLTSAMLLPGPARYCLLEFVLADSFEQLAEDWQALREVLNGLRGGLAARG